ncbi:MAG: hypothetical protein GX901_09650 [Lentisphaerae bacterium]|nr:hypothetical protein [Lentisphaerota bacterium]
MIELEKVVDLYEELGLSADPMYELYINPESNEAESLLMPHYEDYSNVEDIEILRQRIENEPGWIELPHRFELHLGRDLQLGFAGMHLSENDKELVYSFFRGRGAYRRFSEHLVYLGKMEEWYVYKREEITRRLRKWLRVNEIAYSE